MDQSVTPDWDSSVEVSPMNIDFLTQTTIYTWTPDETNAGWFIIVVIAFFAIIIISSMVINQIYSEPEEEEEILTDFFNNRSSKKKKSLKKFLPLHYVNQGYSETTKSNQDSEHHKGPVMKPKKMERNAENSAPGPVQASEAVICISTIF